MPLAKSPLFLIGAVIFSLYIHGITAAIVDTVSAASNTQGTIVSSPSATQAAIALLPPSCIVTTSNGAIFDLRAETDTMLNNISQLPNWTKVQPSQQKIGQLSGICVVGSSGNYVYVLGGTFAISPASSSSTPTFNVFDLTTKTWAVTQSLTVTGDTWPPSGTFTAAVLDDETNGAPLNILVLNFNSSMFLTAPFTYNTPVTLPASPLPTPNDGIGCLFVFLDNFYWISNASIRAYHWDNEVWISPVPFVKPIPPFRESIVSIGQQFNYYIPLPGSEIYSFPTSFFVNMTVDPLASFAPQAQVDTTAAFVIPIDVTEVSSVSELVLLDVADNIEITTINGSVPSSSATLGTTDVTTPISSTSSPSSNVSSVASNVTSAAPQDNPRPAVIGTAIGGIAIVLAGVIDYCL
jgi:hypothetical protein